MGESLVDVVARPGGSNEVLPGGSLANVAVALARLGAEVALLTAYGDDEHGHLLDEHLRRSGVELAADPHVLARTSTAVATLDGSGAASYRFDLSGDLPAPDLIESPAHVHVGSIGALLPPGADLIAETVARLRPTSTISYDLNARPSAVPLDAAAVARVDALVEQADLVKASDEDLLAWRPDATVAESVAYLLSVGVTAVVLTLGEGGARCVTSAGAVDVPAAPADVVDTIGAGDTFAAATLDGLRRLDVLADRDLLAALPLDTWAVVVRRAARAAAITVSRHGADPPTAAELDG